MLCSGSEHLSSWGAQTPWCCCFLGCATSVGAGVNFGEFVYVDVCYCSRLSGEDKQDERSLILGEKIH